ncbi:hypothetical protein [Haloarcula laminariae]|uniref:hypothetical protein n=1 Tax=Haloarcula laminariae TaxID=2961577 RepID=UPI0021C58650|nr:hypothetical protein [Halomicroarcula laminariae]
MAGPDRGRGILTSSDRDYLSGRTNLQDDSERNARNRIRNRTRNGLYDFVYLNEDLENRDVSQIITNSDGINEEIFEAAENVVAFLFRMCAHTPETPGESTDNRFQKLLRNGIKKGLDDRYELLDFKLDLQYGLQQERQNQLLRQLEEGGSLTLAELREALNNDYLDDSFQFRPLDQDGFPKNTEPEETLSHDDY